MARHFWRSWCCWLPPLIFKVFGHRRNATLSFETVSVVWDDVAIVQVVQTACCPGDAL